MTAVVRNDENTDEEGTGQNGNRGGQPPGYLEAPVHRDPEKGVGEEGVDYLPDTPRRRGLLILSNDLFPSRNVGTGVVLGIGRGLRRDWFIHHSSAWIAGLKSLSTFRV